MRKEGNVDVRQETNSVLHALLRAVLKIENIMVLIIHQILKNCYLNIGKNTIKIGFLNDPTLYEDATERKEGRLAPKRSKVIEG